MRLSSKKLLVAAEYDMQAFRDPASGNPGNNVHNDACFLDDNGDGVGKCIGATLQSSGTGYISACPDPDGTGPEFSRLCDLNGDGRSDSREDDDIKIYWSADGKSGSCYDRERW